MTCQVCTLDCGHNCIGLSCSRTLYIDCLYQQQVRLFFEGLIMFSGNIGYLVLMVCPCSPPYPINNLNKFYHLRVYPYVFLFFLCYSMHTELAELVSFNRCQHEIFSSRKEKPFSGSRCLRQIRPSAKLDQCQCS
jgi:hypothetical protein